MRSHRRFFYGLIATVALVVPASAQATFPGANGKIAFYAGGDCVEMINPDGTGRTQTGDCGWATAFGGFTSAAISPDGQRILSPVYNVGNDVYDLRNTKLDGTDPLVRPGFSYHEPTVAWSYDGKLISILTEYDCALCPLGDLDIANADGTGTVQRITPAGDANPYDNVSWGDRGGLAYSTWIQCCSGGSIRTAFPERTVATGDVDSPFWAPGSNQILFRRGSEIAVVNADGTGLHDLTSNTASDYPAGWSSDGQKILFQSNRDGNSEIYVMNPDGSSQVNLTNNPAYDCCAGWSPDGRKIAFFSNRDGDYDIYVMNRDGSGLVHVTNDPGTEQGVGWQPIPYTGYPRPKGAAPINIQLVPAYARCTAPNRSHGAPLSSGSCAPPTQTSSQLTVGTPDTNGQGANLNSKILYGVGSGDVGIIATITDVRKKSDLSDYTGELALSPGLRITDKSNTGPGPGTVEDTTLPVTIPCAATTDTTIGSTCNLSTTINSVYPGALVAGKRAIWQLGQVQVYDGGPDGLASTSSDNTLFLDQGVFVP
jgi:WD40-like Beta Propeller Repeat